MTIRFAGPMAILLIGLAVSAEAARTDLKLGMILEPPHLDPTAGAAAAIDEIVYANVFEGLTRITANGAVAPALAERWTVSDDGLIYTFTLRQGVTFHDGAAFDSSDVRFSFERAMAEGSVNAQKPLFAPIADIATPDTKTVVITLSRPTGGLPWNLAWGDAVIVDPASADDNKTRPNGTGPFRFDRWVKGDRVELTAYADYWGEPPTLRDVTIQFIPDPNAALAALLAGDIDAYPNIPAPEGLSVFEADPRYNVVIGATEGETILATNNARPPFDDVRVRRAIAHALDRQAIVDGAMFGYGTPIGSHFSPAHPDYVDLTGLYPHDPNTARALLADAGHADGFEATLKLPPPSYARRSGEIIAAQLARVGIEIELIPMEWAQWLEQVFRGTDYDLTIVSHTEPFDIGIYARDGYYFNYDNAEFDAVIAELTVTADADRRTDLLHQAQRKLAEDAVNGFLFQLAKHGVWNADLEGLWHNSPVQANDVTGVRWTR